MRGIDRRIPTSVNMTVNVAVPNPSGDLKKPVADMATAKGSAFERLPDEIIEL